MFGCGHIPSWMRFVRFPEFDLRVLFYVRVLHDESTALTPAGVVSHIVLESLHLLLLS